MRISYAGLLKNMLEEHQIKTDEFDRLLRALEAAHYIDSGSIRLTSRHSGEPLTLTAKYTGGMQIGKAKKIGRPGNPKGRGVNAEIVSNVTRIYEDISRRSGVRFTHSYPDMYENECSGNARIGMNESYLPLVLTSK